MPQEKTQAELLQEQADRRAIIANAVADIPQANIDLMCVVIAGDKEQRSASYWLAESFVYVHKYMDRLRKAAQEREDAKKLKSNQALFNQYVAMNPPKNPAELLTIMLRFEVCPQVSVGNVKNNDEAKAA